MLAFNSDRRITAKDALSHPWILKYSESNAISDRKHKEVLKNLYKFNATNKL
jgi:hypothetical protein